MVDDRNPFSGFPTVIAREKIACNKLNILAGIEPAEGFLETVKPARGPNEATKIGKAVFEKLLDHFLADKTVGSCDQDAITSQGDIFRTHPSSRLQPLGSGGCSCNRGDLESFVGGYWSPAFQMAPPPESL